MTEHYYAPDHEARKSLAVGVFGLVEGKWKVPVETKEAPEVAVAKPGILN